MGRLRMFVRWLADYRTGLAFTASILAALLTVAVVDSISSRDRAFDTAKTALTARDSTAAAASRRIDLLGNQIGDLQGQLRDAAEQRAKLDTDVSVLTAQIEQMCRGRAGCGPIVTTPATSAPAGRSAATTTTAASPPAPAPPASPQPTPTTTTTTSPPTTQPPPPPCTASALGHCIVP